MPPRFYHYCDKCKKRRPTVIKNGQALCTKCAAAKGEGQ